ncbi:MAG: hypothetical protein JOZ05_00575 [Acetobacteraceae bacterium]|nr:hypothetical protein [Acetobacteraceae bacterium]
MYDTSDPRASLAPTGRAGPVANEFAGAELARFYEEAAQESGPEGQTWYVRGQNFLVAYTRATPGAVLSRRGQPDEYVVLLPKTETPVEVASAGESKTVPGFSVIMVPPGDSAVTVPSGGEVVRLFTTRSADLAAKCSNAASYASPHPNIPPFQPWPEPPSGYRIRAYSLDVPDQPGRFGRIFRCTTFMVNFLARQTGPRDVTKLSPHHHDDFEQCSLAVEGTYVHHLRWPWTVNMNAWREDEHALCGSPSVTVIPPPAIHTSQAMDKGANQLVDIFCPPRIDFSEKPGWVLNADDYPMPR